MAATIAAAASCTDRHKRNEEGAERQRPAPSSCQNLRRSGHQLGNGGQIVNLPAGNNQPNQPNGTPSQTPGKIVTLPATNTTQNGRSNNTGTANGTTNGTPGKIVSMPVNVGKGGTTVDTKPVVQAQNNPIRVNNGVKLNNNPVNKVQVQNNQQNNRPQFNAANRVVNNGGNNFRQSMNQAPSMGGGNNHRGIMR